MGWDDGTMSRVCPLTSNILGERLFSSQHRMGIYPNHESLLGLDGTRNKRRRRGGKFLGGVVYQDGEGEECSMFEELRLFDSTPPRHEW